MSANGDRATGAQQRSMLVISHTARAEAIEATVNVVAALREAGVRVVMTAEDRREYAPHLATGECAELHTDVAVSDIEIALVLGGDGTILRAAEVIRGSRCPIMGVNLGHVGFLAETEPHHLDYTVERVLAREYTVEERTTLEVQVFDGDELVAETWAVNEATVEKQQRMIEVAIAVDGRPLSSFGCDGVVLSTPTGSTAYSFSAGGPIVWPQVQALMLVPIAAHALFNRPLVVGPDSVLKVQVLPESASLGVIWCDGRRRIELPRGASVEVRSSPEPLRLARIDQAVFSERLVNKFHLPVTGWRAQWGQPA